MQNRYFVLLLALLILTGCTINKDGKLVPLLPPPPAKQGVNRPAAQPPGSQQQGGGQQQGGLVQRDQFRPNGQRYRDKVFNEFDRVNEVFLQGLPTWNNQRANLNIEIFTPKDDNMKRRPCIVFYFGGAWASKMRQGFDVFSSELAMRGYVAVNGDYRVGFHQANLVALCIGDPNRHMREAMFRGVQDTKALIRHLRANADRYGIDPNRIYVAGGSAGGANALGALYLEDSDVPDWISKRIGSLESVGQHQNVSSLPNAAMSLAGPLFAEPSALKKRNVPVYLLQGQCDELIPWDYAKAFPHCKKNANMPMVMGCNALYNALKEMGETVFFDVVCNGGHGSFEWGTVELNRRMANFCFLVMNNQMITGTNIFVPQKNTCPNQKFPGCP
jgi:acetyl esterase/lipase